MIRHLALLFPLHFLPVACGADQLPPTYDFKAVLDEAAYREAVASLPSERIDPAKVEKSPFPTWGIVVTRVTPDSQADKAGIVVGTLLDRYNGREHFHHKQGFAPGPNGKREASGVDPAGGRHDFSFKPGVIGFRSGNAHRPEQYLLKNLPRGKWDADMLVAGVAWQNGRHDLAETALQRATAAGMPPSIFTTCFGALVALDHGDRKASQKLFRSLLGQLPADRKAIPRFYKSFLRTLAVAFQDFGLLETLVADLSGFRGELQAGTLRAWKAWAADSPYPPLLGRARAGENVMPRVVLENADWGGEFRMMDPEPLKDGHHCIEIPPGHYDHRPFAPPAPLRDAVWSMRVALGDGGPMSADGQSKSFTSMSFCLIDRQGESAAARRAPRSRDDRVVAGFELNHDSSGEYFVRLTGGPSGESIDTQHAVPLLDDRQLQSMRTRHEMDLKPLIPPDARTFRLTLVRLGDEAEILLDNHSILHIPVDPAVKDLAFLIHSIGVTFAIDGMTLRPLAPRAGKE